MKKYYYSILMAILITLTVSGCDNSNPSSLSTRGAENGLSIIAGSEIQNIEPVIQQASKELGFPVTVKYSGTIEGVEAVQSGTDYDVTWFGNSKYFYENTTTSKKIKASEKIMLSPVIVGVKPDSFTKNNLDQQKNYSWSDIANWVKDKHMTYGMSDPSLSNSGYVALMGVIYSTTNKGENITVADVKKQTIQNFFSGQKITGKSSNWIMDQFNKSNTDFVINYESVILNNTSKLIPVYPQEGIVTADYQMILVKDDPTKTDRYKKLIAYLKTNQVQQTLVSTYKYRSINSDVMAKQTVFDQSKLLIEMPFNPDTNLSDTILESYFNVYKKPSKFVFIVDTSGSMAGERETNLKGVINNLVNGQLSKYATIRDRDEITVIPVLCYIML